MYIDIDGYIPVSIDSYFYEKKHEKIDRLFFRYEYIYKRRFLYIDWYIIRKR